MSSELKAVTVFLLWIILQPLLYILVNRYILPRWGIRT